MDAPTRAGAGGRQEGEQGLCLPSPPKCHLRSARSRQAQPRMGPPLPQPDAADIALPPSTDPLIAAGLGSQAERLPRLMGDCKMEGLEMVANDDAAEQRVVVGTWVSTVLYGRGRGIVYAIHGEQRPGTIGGRGAVAGGGRAHFDIVFLDGSRTELLPEAVLRGVQWSILVAPIAGDGEIAVALDHALQVEAEEKAEAAGAAEARAAELARLRASPDYAHLTQGDDQHSGKLAAANIRAELKRRFAGVKFSVRKTDHGSIHITWLDGPSDAAVDGAISCYRRGYFDGMTDSYSDARPAWCEVFGGANYISTRRELSDDMIARAIDALFAVRAAYLGGVDKPSVADYRAGRLWNVSVDGLGRELESLVLEQANAL